MRPILFKSERCELEWSETPSELQAAITWYDSVAEALGAPSTIVTCVGRTLKENTAASGVANSLHLSKRAVDLRNHHYSSGYLEILSRTALLLKAKGFEVKVTDHGTAPHFHVGLPERR